MSTSFLQSSNCVGVVVKMLISWPNIGRGMLAGVGNLSLTVRVQREKAQNIKVLLGYNSQVDEDSGTS